MSKSIDKMNKFITLLNISDTKFAESIGKTKDSFFKYRDRAKGKEDHILRVDIATAISVKYRVDVYYFLDDNIPISDDPRITNPIVDNESFKEFTCALSQLTEKVDSFIKKYEASNNDGLKLISKIAQQSVNEVVSVVVKYQAESKKLDLDPISTKILYDIFNYQITSLLQDAQEFKSKIEKIDVNNTKDIVLAIEDVYSFKEEYFSVTRYLSYMTSMIPVIVKLNVNVDKYCVLNNKFEDMLETFTELSYEEKAKKFDLSYRNYSIITLWTFFIVLRDAKNLTKMITQDSNIINYLDLCIKEIFVDEEDNEVYLWSNWTTMNELGNYAIDSLNNPEALDKKLEEAIEILNKNIEKAIMLKPELNV